MDGRFRWLSEGSDPPRPYASRWLGVLLYDPVGPGGTGGLIANAEWFYIDLQQSDPLGLVGETAGSPYGSKVAVELRYKDLGPPYPEPGFFAKWDLTCQNNPPVSYEFRAEHQGFRTMIGFTDTGDDWTPGSTTNWGAPYPYRWCQLWPMAHCYPVETFLPPDLVPKETTVIGALFQYKGPNLNISTAISVPWDTMLWNNAGPLLDPGDNTKIVIPPGYQFVRFTMNQDRTSTSGSFTSFLWKNGGNFPGIPIVTTAPGFSAFLRNNYTSPWLEVIPGDYFEVRAQSASSQLVGSSERTWVAIELGNP
ncbi:MAG: hypothetical protein OEY63_02130 [Gemmatimonadota bacterium]|nr:hypothetical protein [Gemmatimonadota bacterium]